MGLRRKAGQTFFPNGSMGLLAGRRRAGVPQAMSGVGAQLLENNIAFDADMPVELY